VSSFPSSNSNRRTTASASKQRGRLGPLRAHHHIRGLSVALAVTFSALLVAGCGLGAGIAPKGVQLTVTREFGARGVGGANSPKVVGQETVMSLLMRNYAVTTKYGGGFVQSIDGLSGGHEHGEAVDWFYYVNGIEASEGAAETDAHSGDHVWWDLHDWSATDDIPAVVGSFPEPFISAAARKRLPVRIECAPRKSEPCSVVSARMRALGVPTTVTEIGDSPSSGALRVLVGTWPAVSKDPVVQSIESGPGASGIYARFSNSGNALTLLNQSGSAQRTLAADAGLIAATRSGESPPVWVIAGTDESGVRQAANALNQADLHNHFAVAATGSAPISLPVGGS